MDNLHSMGMDRTPSSMEGSEAGVLGSALPHAPWQVLLLLLVADAAA